MAEGDDRRQRRRRALVPYLLVVGLALPLALYYLIVFRAVAPVHWRSRDALVLLFAVPLVTWVSFHLDRQRVGTLAFTRTRELAVISQGVFGGLVHLPRACLIVAIGLLAVALARPQRLAADASEVEGIDIVVALDVSNSMVETDLLPDRLGAAKRVIDGFLQRNRGDRIGLVIFGKEAFTQCPLTLDTRAVRGLLAEVRLGLIDGRGTAIGNALGTSINRLRRSTAKSKVIVLVTDGDDNASKLDPRQAAKYAQTFGVKVFTILIGRDSLATEVAPRYPVNPKLLEEIAEATGGTPFLATDNEALERRFQAILEDLDRSKLKSQTPHYAELYPLFVTPALILLLLEIALSLTRFRRFP